MNQKLITSMMCCMLLLTPMALALEFPDFLNLQAVLRDPGTGDFITGSKSVNVTFVNQSDLSNVYTEVKSDTLSSYGVLNRDIGLTTPFSYVIFKSGLSQQISIDGETLPLQNFSIVPYAVSSVYANESDYLGGYTAAQLLDDTDTNETTRFNALVATDCTGNDKVIGVASNGAVVCGTDNNTDTDTTYTAGDGLTLGGTEFSINAVTSGAGNYSYWNGSAWLTAQDVDTDTDTTYTAGNGLVLSGTIFNLSSETCAGTDKLQWNGTHLICSADVDTDTDTTYTAGAGLTLTGTEFNHTDTSSQASVDSSGRTYIQDVTLDTFGHVTGLVTATETVTDTDTYWNQSAIAPLGVNDTHYFLTSCADTEILKYNATSAAWECEADDGGAATDHGTLTGLADDDHTQYALLAGRAGGQTINGGNAASETLDIRATSHATKGVVTFHDDLYIDQANGQVAIGVNPVTITNTEELMVQGRILVEYVTSPIAEAGYGKIYAKSDDNLYFLDDNGNEVDLTAGAGVTDTNETTRFNALVGTDCTGNDKVIGVANDGTLVCGTDNNTGSAYTAGNGLVLTGTEFNISAVTSGAGNYSYWNGTAWLTAQDVDTNTNIIDDNLYNTTQMQVQSDSKLGILESWLTSFIEAISINSAELDNSSIVRSGTAAGGDLTGTYTSPTLASGVVSDNEIDYTTVTVNDFTNDAGYYNAEANLTAVLDDNYVDVSGDTMTGDLNLGGFDVQNIAVTCFNAACTFNQTANSTCMIQSTPTTTLKHGSAC